MDMYLINRSRFVTFQLQQVEFCPSTSSQSKIKIDFAFKSMYNKYIRDQDSTRFLEPYLPSSNLNTSACVSLGLLEDMWAAVDEAVSYRFLDDEGEREDLIGFALREVREKLTGHETLPEFKDLVLSIQVLITNARLYIGRSDCAGTTVRGAYSSLEKYEVEEERECCCICLELVTGSGLRMPCLHVFHGGCIDKWLSTSRYCPLCRYEMPLQENTRFDFPD